MSVFRSMRAGRDSFPVCGSTARTLGVRVPDDIKPDIDGLVHPETGGMSVAVGTPENLRPHRRPPSFGGRGKDPVFHLLLGSIEPDLSYRADPKDPESHGFIEPGNVVALDAYQEALCDTRSEWRILT